RALVSCCLLYPSRDHRYLPPFPTRRSSDLFHRIGGTAADASSSWSSASGADRLPDCTSRSARRSRAVRLLPAASSSSCSASNVRSEEHTSELQSRENLVCRLLLEKKKNKTM